MANYPKELIGLVDDYLTDGIISAKERQVLLKKAEKMGVDVDEFDLYLDSRQQKEDIAVEKSSRKKRGKVCPFCGGVVPQLAEKCPNCGEDITPEASTELQEIIEQLESFLVECKSGWNIERNKAMVERYIRKANMYYGNNPKVQKLLAGINSELEMASVSAKKDARKRNIVNILTYNTKLTIGVAIAVLIAIIITISKVVNSVRSDPQPVIVFVNKAISEGDLVAAEARCKSYKESFGSYSVREAFNALAIAYAKQGDISRALDLCYASDINRDDPTRNQIQNMCIEKGDYDMAEKCISYCYESDEYFDFLCRVLNHMKKNGASVSELRAFVNMKAALYELDAYHKHWRQQEVKRRLCLAAGI